MFSKHETASIVQLHKLLPPEQECIRRFLLLVVKVFKPEIVGIL